MDLETPREVDYLIEMIYRKDRQTRENQLVYFSHGVVSHRVLCCPLKVS